MTEPLGDLVRIRTNLKRIADEKGLDIQIFTIVPGQDEDGPHQCMVMFRTKADEDKPDDRFDQIIKAEKEAEQKSKKEAMKEERFTRLPDDLDQIKQDLRGDGLLDD